MLPLRGQVQVHDSLSGSITTLTLTKLTDSRCPTDVLCVQAGEVVAQLQASAGDAAPVQTLDIARAATPYAEGSAPATSSIAEKYEPAAGFGKGYKLLLLQALPYPEAKTASKANQVLLRVVRVGTN